MDKPKLVIHVGLPKTGSTSLQVWCDSNRQTLADEGVHYPQPEQGQGKHANAVLQLLDGDVSAFEQVTSQTLSRITLISNEGFSNHLWDFKEPGISRAKEILQGFDVTAYAVHRDYESWSRAWWKQCSQNGYVDQYVYGTPKTLEQFRNEERVRRLHDIDQIRKGFETRFGITEIVFTQKPSDWYRDLCQLLELKDPAPEPAKREHVSPPIEMIELIRIANAFRPETKLRSLYFSCLQRFVKSGHDQLALHANVGCSPEQLKAVLDFVQRLGPVEEKARILHGRFIQSLNEEPERYID